MSSMSAFGEAEYRGETSVTAIDIKFQEGNIKVENLSFQIVAGDIFGVVGAFLPESIRMFQILTGTEKPPAGSLTYQPYGDFRKARDAGRVGVYLRGSSLVPEMTLRENFILVGRLRGSSHLESTVAEILSIFDLSSFSEKKVKSIPKNIANKAMVAATFVNSPDFLFLDDFVSVLDRDSSNAVVNYLRSESGLGRCICMLTDEPEPICNRVLMLRGPKGPIVDSPSAILESTLGSDTVEIRVRSLAPSEAERILTPIQASWLFESANVAVLYVRNTETSLDHVFNNLTSSGAKIVSVGAKKPSFRLMLGPIYRGGSI